MSTIKETIRKKYSSLKSKLILLTFITIIPVLFVMLYSDMKERHSLEIDTKNELTSFSLLTKNNVNNFVETTRKLLVTISQSEILLKGDSAAITQYFRILMQHFPDYVNIGMADLKGNILYSAHEMKKPVNSADLFWFKNVLETSDFSVGEYQIGRIVGHPVLVLSQPVFDKQDRLRFVVYISLRISWLTKLIENINLSEDYVFILSDRNGTIITRYPDNGLWKEKKMFQANQPETSLHQSDRIVETDKIDGIKRFYVFSTASNRNNNIYIAIGKSSESIYNKLNKTLWTNLSLLFFVIAIGLIAASLFSNLFILRPINKLKTIAQKLSQKDFSVRSDESSNDNDFGILAKTFNDMAESIERYVNSQKLAEESLRESNQLIHNIIDNSPSLIYLLDLEGKFTLVNKRMETVFCLPQDKMIGSPRGLIMPANITDQHQSNDQYIIDSKLPHTFEEENIEPDGKHFYLTEKFPLIDSDGNVYSIGGISTDITERKQADIALQESNERLKLILESNPIAIWDWNLETDTWFATQKYYTMLGYQPETGNPDRHIWLNRVHPDDRQFVKQKIADVLNHQLETYNYDARMLHADGSYRWQSVIGHVIERDENKKPLRMLGIRMDISEQKKAEESLMNSYEELKITQRASLNLMEDLQTEIEVRKLAENENKKLNETLEQRVMERTMQLEAANNELEAFSYSVSHDLRAPLRHISGFVDLLSKEANDQLTEKEQHYLNIINDSAKKMGILIDDLLSFSRTGRAEMTKTVFNMNQVLEEAKSQVNITPENRAIHWSIATLPDIFGDYNLLRQVWINLIDNAVKYTRTREKSEIQINCQSQKEEYIFSIRDNGVGFDMQYAQKLFGVFQRLHSITEFEGTGIGLASVRRIIARHGGRIWAEAELDKGATFYFTLPKNKK
ncbi:MAG: PAS domain S-box protein [Bacteroidales bacterium]|nr:PAS domain S-box protein [Bacteroidales bacterium]